jgi:protein-tyrosine-phosphatase
MAEEDGREKRESIIFLCTYNSVRSQMAEALMRHLNCGRFRIFSAGIAPSGLHPYARRVLEEDGIDTSGLRSKSVNEFRGQTFDYVVTLCSDMDGSCLDPPGTTRVIALPFRSPPEIGDDEEILAGFRELREEIRSFLEERFG